MTSNSSLCRIAFCEVESLDDLIALLRWNLDQLPLLSSSSRSYHSRFNQFAAFLESRIDSINFTGHQDLLRLCTYLYLDELKHKNANIHTLNNFLALFRLLYKSVGAEVSGLDNLPTKKSRKCLSREEQLKFLQSACDEACSRNRVLALLFLTTDIRLGECARLRVTDIRWSGGQVILRVAGRSSSRDISPPPRVAAALQAWLQERSMRQTGDSQLLFPGSRGDKITTSAIDLIIRKIGLKCGLVVSTTVLRNTLIDQGL